jgi:hypothetical protein
MYAEANMGHPSRTEDASVRIGQTDDFVLHVELGAIANQCTASRVGQRTVKMAPLAPFAFLDSTCTLPPCRSAISLHTHNPSPVPTSFLVVIEWLKNSFEVLRSNPWTIVFDL